MCVCVFVCVCVCVCVEIEGEESGGLVHEPLHGKAKYDVDPSGGLQKRDWSAA